MKQYSVSALVFILMASQYAFSSDLEKRYLKELEDGLESYKSLIYKAQNAHDINAAYIVRYDILIREYEKLLQGVKDIVNVPRREPRRMITNDQLTPITGSYLQ